MARLTCDPHQMQLRWRHRVGRGPGHDLTSTDSTVSADHAVLVWVDHGWHVRDLGSRNGTWVGTQQAVAGENTPLALGDVLRFGSAPEQWRLTDDTAPQPFANSEALCIRAEAGLLSLPPDAPKAVVFHSWTGTWTLERDGEATEVQDRERIVVDGVVYELHLPHEDAATLDAPPATLETTELRFEVSSDEEHVRIEAACGLRTWDLGTLDRHYLLLTLARLRTSPSAPDGWVSMPQLCRMLRLEENAVDQQIHRARQQLARLGFVGAARLVERRPGRELRLGIPPGRLTVGEARS